MRVGICIVFYKDTQHLQRLSESIKGLNFRDFQIYFTDNNPLKTHVETFKNHFPEAIYIESIENTGFAKGNNVLAKQAAFDGCDFIWILNPDMSPKSSCLSELLKCIIVHKNTEAVGPVLLYGEESRSNKIQFAGSKVNFKTQVKHAFYIDKSLSELPKISSQIVDLINGGSLLINAERVKNEMLFDEEYFMYNDELDLMRRIRNNGKEVRVVFSAISSHHHDWSKKNANSYQLMYYYIMRNKVLYWRKYKHTFIIFKSMLEYLVKLPVVAMFCMRTSGYKLLYFYYLGLLHGYLGKKGKSPRFEK
jgi:GT2 family glycosyltransferase